MLLSFGVVVRIMAITRCKKCLRVWDYTGEKIPVKSNDHRSPPVYVTCPDCKTPTKLVVPNGINEKLRDAAILRDGVRCTVVSCGSNKDLQVHHIRGKKNKDLKYMRTYCRKCHMKAGHEGAFARMHNSRPIYEWYE
jgi:RNase P subunit RPR2